MHGELLERDAKNDIITSFGIHKRKIQDIVKVKTDRAKIKDATGLNRNTITAALRQLTNDEYLAWSDDKDHGKRYVKIHVYIFINNVCTKLTNLTEFTCYFPLHVSLASNKTRMKSFRQALRSRAPEKRELKLLKLLLGQRRQRKRAESSLLIHCQIQHCMISWLPRSEQI